MDAAEKNHVSRGLGSLVAQPKGIAHEIGRVLQFRDLVIMGQNDGVPLFLKLLQLLGQIDPAPGLSNAKIYTGTYHPLVSGHLMDSQPSASVARLGFIGAGKLVGSLIRGLLRSGKYSATSIIAGEPNESARDALRKETGVRATSGNIEVVTQADVVFVGVKPAIVLPALKEIRSHS